MPDRRSGRRGAATAWRAGGGRASDRRGCPRGRGPSRATPPRHAHRMQLAGEQQAHQVLGVAAVGLDLLGRPARDLARRRDHALDPRTVERAGKPIARRPRLIAAWSAAKSPGPLRAFAQRTAARRGRKRRDGGRGAQARRADLAPAHSRRGLRLRAPSARRPQVPRARAARRRPAPQARGPKANPVWTSAARERAERQLDEQVEAAYQQLASDLQTRGPKGGCGRDTGARTFKALEGQSSATDLKAQAVRALARRSPTPKWLVAQTAWSSRTSSCSGR